MAFSLDEIRQMPDPALRMELLLAGAERLRQPAVSDLRELASQEPHLFLGVAYRWCWNHATRDSAATRLFAEIAVEQGVLLEALTVPGELTPAESSLLIRCLAHFCSGADRRMIENLAAQVDATSAPAGLFRLLDEMCHLDLSGASRTTLVCLLRSPNARVRSKAAEALVRTTQSADTAILLLNDPDNRVRANALEGLWPFASSPSVRQVFEQYARSLVPRIAVNAVIGLYHAGHPTARSRLLELAESEDLQMRQAAVWAMGYLVDPAFEEPLRILLRLGQPSIRGQVLRALVRFNQSRSPAASAMVADSPSPASVAGILSAGAAVWNRWRSRSRELRPNLDNECFAGLDLSGADLSYCSLWGADFRGAKLGLANLFGADLRDADFRGARLNRTDLRAIHTSPATQFAASELRGAALHGTLLPPADGDPPLCS